MVADNREARVNGRIRAREVRLIDHEGVQMGIVPLPQALDMADDAGLDLVEVAAQARPPVCRIMDFGKFKYQKKKRQAEAKKRQSSSQLKEVKIRYKTDDHDLATKMRRATEFLNDGHKVKFMMFFKGREIQFTALGQQTMEKIAADMMDVAVLEQSPRMEGRVLTMYFMSKAGKKEEGGRA
ncbi:MAG: translation initiation factor IF-3 [Deltaproteobacteria bacterium]|nr:translation initiation factor IF-3 [Deltaproteobacteria bacterium]